MPVTEPQFLRLMCMPIPPPSQIFGTGRGTRTPTPFRASVPKTDVSAIPPYPHCFKTSSALIPTEPILRPHLVAELNLEVVEGIEPTYYGFANRILAIRNYHQIEFRAPSALSGISSRDSNPCLSRNSFISWHGQKDSNPQQKFWRLPCYQLHHVRKFW